ncbi:MAG: hypothetical protein E7Z91_01310 [Cyanobacteria bacterium SIG30]|nr:hypothetical protein [Cyanobacteria bacterium SIG30]
MRIQSAKENIKSYANAATFGVVGGYALKHLLPLSSYEKNDVFTPEVLDNIKHIVNGAKKSEFDAIELGVKEGSEEIAENVLDLFKANKNNILSDKFDEVANNLKDVTDKTKEGVQVLIKRVQRSGEMAEEVSRKSYEALAKNSRPTFYFVALLSAITLSVAVLKKSLKNNIEVKPDKKDFDIYY